MNKINPLHSVGIIEINDVSVCYTVASKRTTDDASHIATSKKNSEPYTQRAWQSMAIAVVNDDEILFGEQAWQQSRLHPLRCVDHFWHRLSLEPLSFDHKLVANFADLAYQHLLHLYQHDTSCEHIILAVPSHFNQEQLALLLGIAEQCPFEVIGIVDNGLLASTESAINFTRNIGTAFEHQIIYAELHLHHVLLSLYQITDAGLESALTAQASDIARIPRSPKHLTELNKQAEYQLQLSDHYVINQCGLVDIYKQWAHLLTNEFVHSCRFDPLHHANSEQALYNLLPDLLIQPVHSARSDVVQVAIDDKQVKVDRKTLIAKSQPLFHQIKQGLNTFMQLHCGAHQKTASLHGIPASLHIVMGQQLASISGLSAELHHEVDEVRLKMPSIDIHIHDKGVSHRQIAHQICQFQQHILFDDDDVHYVSSVPFHISAEMVRQHAHDTDIQSSSISSARSLKHSGLKHSELSHSELSRPEFSHPEFSHPEKQASKEVSASARQHVLLNNNACPINAQGLYCEINRSDISRLASRLVLSLSPSSHACCKFTRERNQLYLTVLTQQEKRIIQVNGKSLADSERIAITTGDEIRILGSDDVLKIIHVTSKPETDTLTPSEGMYGS
ncbi:hypothetical protein [Flocculibacter collagenilyticus]|uniref:hypothetical protein n=1 Tax=Flocculibacter collagenilyticus TaxID=2744479 RepID=UPI0018F6D4C0|nr:hypothetical protein [Flocculibacter collagenilyticus]